MTLNDVSGIQRGAGLAGLTDQNIRKLKVDSNSSIIYLYIQINNAVMLFAAMCCSATIVQRRVASSLDPLLSSRARPAQGSYTRTLAPSREQSASLGQDHSCPRCVGRLLFICCFTRHCLANPTNQPTNQTNQANPGLTPESSLCSIFKVLPLGSCLSPINYHPSITHSLPPHQRNLATHWHTTHPARVPGKGFAFEALRPYILQYHFLSHFRLASLLPVYR